MVHAGDADDIESGSAGPASDLDGVVAGRPLLEIPLYQSHHLRALPPEHGIQVFDMTVCERRHEILALDLEA